MTIRRYTQEVWSFFKTLPNLETLRDIHLALTILFIRASYQRGGADPFSDQLIRKLANRLPRPLSKIIIDPFFHGVHIINQLLISLEKSCNPEFGNLDYIIAKIKRYLKKVGAILIVDCLSLIEFLSLMIFAKKEGYNVDFLDLYFLNFPGFTRFLTRQLGDRGTLGLVAKLFAEKLNASRVKVYSYIDKLVHDPEAFNFDKFLERIPIELLYKEIILQVSKFGSVLIMSDHGYNIIKRGDILYVDHGTSQGIVKLNNMAFFMIIRR